jgi:DNA-directed RNA polymerase subunit M/transcription elongation factor TFIIS
MFLPQVNFITIVIVIKMCDEHRAIVRANLSKFLSDEIACDMEEKIYDTTIEYADNPEFEYDHYAYQIIGIIASGPSAHDVVAKDIVAARARYSLTFYFVFSAMKLQRIRIRDLKPESVTGVFTCKRCKGDKFWIWTAQTRAGDEGATTFAQCTTCPPEHGRFKM